MTIWPSIDVVWPIGVCLAVMMLMVGLSGGLATFLASWSIVGGISIMNPILAIFDLAVTRSADDFLMKFLIRRLLPSFMMGERGPYIVALMWPVVSARPMFIISFASPEELV